MIWIGNLLQGDFGRSYALNRPVLDEILERLRPDPVAGRQRRILFCTLFGVLGGHRLGRSAPVRLGR